MSRLTHPYSAYIRALQMTRTQMLVFVEGKNGDVNYYAKICSVIAERNNVDYEIRMAEELPGATGGKTRLIEFHDFLRSKRKLITDFESKKTGVIFIVDKDVDDFKRTIKRSKHLIYTLYHSVENHIFNDGDLVQGVAAAASMDPNIVAYFIGNQRYWLENSAYRWLDWVKICVFINKYKIRGQANYGVSSRVNNPIFDPVDTVAHAQVLASIETSSGMIPADFVAKYELVSRKVEILYTSGQHDFVFKGKWYSLFLQDTAMAVCGVRPFRLDKFSAHITSHVAATVTISQNSFDHFSVKLNDLALRL